MWQAVSLRVQVSRPKLQCEIDDCERRVGEQGHSAAGGIYTLHRANKNAIAPNR
jgi:hypothetical protein